MKATGIVRRIDDLGRVVIHIKKAFDRWSKAFLNFAFLILHFTFLSGLVKLEGVDGSIAHLDLHNNFLTCKICGSAVLKANDTVNLVTHYFLGVNLVAVIGKKQQKTSELNLTFCR